MLLAKLSVKCGNHGSMSQLVCINSSLTTPPTSISGETSSASKMLPKGMVVRVLLVHC
jgi:hypothetical protein